MAVSAGKVYDFLHCEGTHRAHCWYSSKTDSPDLFWIDLNHIDEQHSVVVGYAVSGTEDQYKFGDVIETSCASWRTANQPGNQIAHACDEEAFESDLFAFGGGDEEAGDGIGNDIGYAEDDLEHKDVDLELIDGWVGADVERAEQEQQAGQIDRIVFEGFILEEVFYGETSAIVLLLLVLLLQLHHPHHLLLSHLALKTIDFCYFAQTFQHCCATIFVEIVGSILQIQYYQQ